MSQLRDLPIVRQSREHIEASHMGYFEHMWHAFSLGWILIVVGLSSLVHAFIPVLYPGTAAKEVMRIFYKYCLDHPSPVFQAARRKFELQFAKKP